jgi:hypothetical protein
MIQFSCRKWGDKPLLFTYEEAQHALGWTDEQMATIKPFPGFKSKAAEKRWPQEMKTSSFSAYFLFMTIYNCSLCRRPYLFEAVEMARQRIASANLLDADAQAMV